RAESREWRRGLLAADEKSGAAGAALAREPQARRRVLVRADDDVLEEIGEGGIHRTLVLTIDLDVVGDRPEMGHRVARFGKDHARALAVLRAGRVELLERF